MAVAEITRPETAKKMDKSDNGDSGKTKSKGPSTSPVAWVTGKWNELKTFFVEVRAELKKVTWPSRDELYSTTLVVIGTTIFFGFYLWAVDLLYTKILAQLLR